MEWPPWGVYYKYSCMAPAVSLSIIMWKSEVPATHLQGIMCTLLACYYVWEARYAIYIV